jgi:hypothetical protein
MAKSNGISLLGTAKEQIAESKIKKSSRQSRTGQWRRAGKVPAEIDHKLRGSRAEARVTCGKNIKSAALISEGDKSHRDDKLNSFVPASEFRLRVLLSRALRERPSIRVD